MRAKTKLFLAIVAIALLGGSTGYSSTSKEGNAKIGSGIVTSDTILSGMIASLLPPNRYPTEAVLPPGQCPGHYDVKLSDIEKIKMSDLVVSFKGMPFMDKTGPGGKAQFLVDAGGRNWMAPDSYIYGLGFLADALSKFFPKDKDEIMKQKGLTVLMTLHDPNLAMLFSDAAILIDRGLLVASGSPQTVITEENLKRVYGIDVTIHDWNATRFVSPRIDS